MEKAPGEANMKTGRSISKALILEELYFDELPYLFWEQPFKVDYR